MQVSYLSGPAPCPAPSVGDKRNTQHVKRHKCDYIRRCNECTTEIIFEGFIKVGVVGTHRSPWQRLPRRARVCTGTLTVEGQPAPPLLTSLQSHDSHMTTREGSGDNASLLLYLLASSPWLPGGAVRIE